ncbi:MAG TPA: hypothetical protein VEU77_09205, partial [Candidatus Acidoferrales bacterium]|nr:hypothetical protein [Candidatus Acidoferrales bacterium]
AALASALGAAGIFLFARRFAPAPVALLAGAAYAADPLVWQYSEIAYPYTVLGLGSLVVAWAAYRARGRGAGAAIVASVAFGIAAGFRQDLLILLAPLWLWSLRPLGIRGAIRPALALGAACLLWLIPTVILSDGVEAYANALLGQAAYVGQTYSIVGQGVPALVANVAMTIWAAGWGLLLAAPLAVAGVALLGRRAARALLDSDAGFFLVWCVPPLLIYVGLHIGDWGYVLSALPGLYIVAAHALGSLARARGRVVIGAGWAGLVAAPALLFAASGAPFSASEIAAHDRGLQTRFAYVRDHFTAERTLILTREDFLLVRYYLPDYHARQHDPDPYVRTSRRMRAGHVDQVVVFTPGLAPEQAADVRHVACAAGVELVYLDVAPGTVLEFRGERYAVASPAP